MKVNIIAKFPGYTVCVELKKGIFVTMTNTSSPWVESVEPTTTTAFPYEINN